VDVPVRLVAFLLAAGFAILFGNGSAHGAEHIVTMPGESFAPEQVDVRPGDVVTWVNPGLGGHNVRSIEGLFRSQNLTGGDRYSFTFTKPGRYDYLCSIHPSNMQGVVTVIALGAAPSPTRSMSTPLGTARPAPTSPQTSVALASITEPSSIPISASSPTQVPEPIAAPLPTGSLSPAPAGPPIDVAVLPPATGDSSARIDRQTSRNGTLVGAVIAATLSAVAASVFVVRRWKR